MIFVEKGEIILNFLARRFEVKKAVSLDERLGTIEEVLVDGQAIKGQFFNGVAILVNNFHLLNNGRLSTFARACDLSVSQSVLLAQYPMRDHLPSRRILHSLRNRLESSSSFRSIN